jgi:hypothetical protein
MKLLSDTKSKIKLIALLLSSTLTVMAGAMTGVKEQVADSYAELIAKAGYVTLVSDIDILVKVMESQGNMRILLRKWRILKML